MAERTAVLDHPAEALPLPTGEQAPAPVTDGEFRDWIANDMAQVEAGTVNLTPDEEADTLADFRGLLETADELADQGLSPTEILDSYTNRLMIDASQEEFDGLANEDETSPLKRRLNDLALMRKSLTENPNSVRLAAVEWREQQQSKETEPAPVNSGEFRDWVSANAAQLENGELNLTPDEVAERVADLQGILKAANELAGQDMDPAQILDDYSNRLMIDASQEEFDGLANQEDPSPLHQRLNDIALMRKSLTENPNSVRLAAVEWRQQKQQQAERERSSEAEPTPTEVVLGSTVVGASVERPAVETSRAGGMTDEDVRRARDNLAKLNVNGGNRPPETPSTETPPPIPKAETPRSAETTQETNWREIAQKLSAEAISPTQSKEYQEQQNAILKAAQNREPGALEEYKRLQELLNGGAFQANSEAEFTGVVKHLPLKPALKEQIIANARKYFSMGRRLTTVSYSLQRNEDGTFMDNTMVGVLQTRD